MRELDEVLGAALDAGTRTLDDARPDPATATAVTSAVRARRRRRHAIEAAAVVPVAALVVVGVWAAAGRGPAPEATQPPAPSPSVTEPTPEPSSSAPVQAPDPMTTDLGLPAGIEPMPEGFLETVGPGWALGVYEPAPWVTDSVGAPISSVVVLGFPGGPTYEVTRVDPTADLPPDLEWRSLSLVDWHLGDTTALVRVVYPDGDGDGTAYRVLYDLDLVTGALSVSDLNVEPGVDVANGVRLLGVADGRAVWLDYQGGWSGDYRLLVGGTAVDIPETAYDGTFSPDRRYLVMNDGTVVDLLALTVIGTLPLGAQEWCTPVGWWTSTELLAACTDTDTSSSATISVGMNPRLETFPLDGAALGHGTVLRALASGDPWPQATDGYLADHRLAVDAWNTVTGGSITAVAAAYLLTEEGFTALPGPDTRPHAVADWVVGAAGQVYVTSYVDSGGMEPRTLGAIEPASGNATTATVFGPPTGTPPGGGAWADGLTSWAVGR